MKRNKILNKGATGPHSIGVEEGGERREERGERREAEVEASLVMMVAACKLAVMMRHSGNMAM